VQENEGRNMNDKRLRIYLDDHSALMVGEIELARRCQSSNRRTPLGNFLERLEVEIQAQQSVVRDVMRRVGGTESVIKKGAAWAAEKLGRLKLNDTLITYSKLSRVIELETLAMAAQQRAALWDNLAAVAANDQRLTEITFSFFRDQSWEHLEELDRRRRYAAVEAFLGK
jgi:hypothetical protein